MSFSLWPWLQRHPERNQEAGPGLGPDRPDAINAIHGRFGAQVALLQSLIPRTVAGHYPESLESKSANAMEKKLVFGYSIGVEID